MVLGGEKYRWGLGCLSAVLLMSILPAQASAQGVTTLERPAVDHPRPDAGRLSMRPVPTPTPQSLSRVAFTKPVQARSVTVPARSTTPRPRDPRNPLSIQTNPLLFQGGYVLNSVSIYVDFWGPEWQDLSQTPVISYVEGFFNDLGGSPWTGTMGQYCSGIATNASACPFGTSSIQNPVGQLKGSVIDTNPAPAAPTFLDIQAEAAALVAYYGSPGDSVFMVYTPSGKSQAGFETTFCAYHTFVQVGSYIFPYGYMPYQPDAGMNCGANLVDGPLDGYSIIGGHEYAEAVTDPFPTAVPGYTGWLDPTIGSQGEIGDKCAWNPTPGNVTMNGHTWPVQTLFSNAALAQGQSPCVFAPSVTSVNSLSPSVGQMAGGTSVTITGVNFLAVTAVKFGTNAATTFAVSSSSQIVAKSPPGAGTVDVTVTDSFGTSATAVADEFVYFGVPSAPTAVTASGGNAQATVVWSAPSNDGGSPVTGYRVTPYVASVPQTPILAGLVSNLMVTGLANGTAYTFTVATLNAAGAGAESNQSNSVTPATVPGLPTEVTAHPGNLEATISWTAPVDDGGIPLTSYTVNCSPACAPVVVGGSTLSAIVTGLPADVAITFTVTASNLIGPGSPSKPSAPIDLRSSTPQSFGANPPSRSDVTQSRPNPGLFPRTSVQIGPE
jgi:hypothetical protein